MRSFSRLVVAGTLLIACCYGFARFAYGLFTPTLSAEFGLTPTTVGAIGSASYVGYCIAITTSAVLTGRIGARRAAVLAGVVATLGICTVAVAPSTPVLAAGVLVAGCSTGLASPPLAAAVARWVDEAVQDRAQTVVNAGTGIGVIVSTPIALLLLGHWRWAWGVMAVLAAAVTVLVARAIPAASASADAAERVTPRPVLRAGATSLIAASGLVGFGSIAVWNFGRGLTADLGDAVSVGVWAVLGVAGIAGALSGDSARWLGLAGAWRAAIALMAAATVGYAYYAQVPVVVTAAAAVFGATYIAITGLAIVWATRVYPDGAAFGVAASFFAIAAGQAIGAPVIGAVIESTSEKAGFGAAAAAAAAAALLRPARRPEAEG